MHERERSLRRGHEVQFLLRLRIVGACQASCVWTTAAQAAAGQWKKAKSRKLRARDDNPCGGIAAPDRDGDKELQWLYPSEFITLVSCVAVPLDCRRLYALVTCLFLRGGELKTLTWPDVDIERGIISVRRSYDRSTGRVKRTKTNSSKLLWRRRESNLVTRSGGSRDSCEMAEIMLDFCLDGPVWYRSGPSRRATSRDIRATWRLPSRHPLAGWA